MNNKKLQEFWSFSRNHTDYFLKWKHRIGRKGIIGNREENEKKNRLTTHVMLLSKGSKVLIHRKEVRSRT